MSTFSLPDLGEGLHEAEITAWHVSVGDHVIADQPLVSVETEKAVVEIPSPQSGQIAAVFGKPGDIIAVGAALVDFASSEVESADTIVGELPHEKEDRDKPSVTPVQPDIIDQDKAHHGKAAPAVRRLAKELGIDLKDITGTGPGEVITQSDVRHARPSYRLPEGAEPLRGPRRAMAQAMKRAGAEIVPATVTGEARIDHWTDGTDITVRLIKATIAGCQAEPALNAWFDPVTGQRKLHDNIDLGIAFDTPDGLFVPVIGNAAALDIVEIRKVLDQLTEGVTKRSLSRADLTGQTITLSNFGSIGGIYANLVVNPPQVAILGAGRMFERAVAKDGDVLTAKFLPLSLSFDHRVVTGGEAVRFLNAMIAALEKVDEEQDH